MAIPLLLRFYCALAVSAMIHRILTKISIRSGIAGWWNVGPPHDAVLNEQRQDHISAVS